VCNQPSGTSPFPAGYAAGIVFFSAMRVEAHTHRHEPNIPAVLVMDLNKRVEYSPRQKDAETYIEFVAVTTPRTSRPDYFETIDSPPAPAWNSID
jgi:hypothetical protein